MYEQYYFQYSITKRAKCGACLHTIPKGHLRAKFTRNISTNGSPWYHFKCFWEFKIQSTFSKRDIMIHTQNITQAFFDMNGILNIIHDNRLVEQTGGEYASLETLELNGEDMNPLITQEDINKICEHFALSLERRTAYYLPIVVRCSVPVPCCFSRMRLCENAMGATFHLRYRGDTCYPECLAESRLVNIDAKEFKNYHLLYNNERRYMDRLFKKNDAVYYSPHAVVADVCEHCKSEPCVNISPYGGLYDRLPLYEKLIKVNQLRIHCGRKAYHPLCFGLFHKIKANAQDVFGYDKLDNLNKAVLSVHLQKPPEYDTPFVKVSEENGYCCAESCLYSQTPSKLPYPYTIFCGQLQIKCQNKIYHPECFQAYVKIDFDAKDIGNYDLLTLDIKQALGQIFKKDEKGEIDGNDYSQLDGEESKENRMLDTMKFKDGNNNNEAV